MTDAFPFLHVYPTPGHRSRGWLVAGDLRLPCALGKTGVASRKREGDGATPRAALPLRRIWWRRDRSPHPRTRLPVRPVRWHDGWCDAVGDRNYNRLIRLPYAASHEKMWREDHLYDLVVELGWNDRPRRQGRGSAIFMHIARPGFHPTEGCVALRKADLRKLLPRLGPYTVLIVH